MRILLWGVVVGSLALTGCSGGNKTSESSSSTPAATGASAQISPSDLAKAKETFSSRCAVCHGPGGKGDGPGGQNLTPKPPNFTDKAWQASITDENIEKAILYGGAGIGKSPMMPASPDLQAQPQMVTALRQTVRNFGK